MDAWLKAFNKFLKGVKPQEAALEAYVFAHVAFVRIHPFFDGNGRLARLLANIPVLAAGFPPIVVPSEARLDYVRKLRECQIWNKRYRFLSVEGLDIYGKDSALFYDILAA